MIQKKKSLGQHFLHNSAHLKVIADAVEIEPGETVLEIGPGEGVLTEALLARGARVVAIEKDHRLIPLLNEKFAGSDFKIYEGDALKYDISYFFDPDKKYKLVGNIPYYITGALLRKFLSAQNQPSLLVFLLQKEVAERIARSKKESILSLAVKAYGEPRYVKTVPAGAFVPPPKVDSAILVVKNISRKNFVNAQHEQRFFELLHKGFGSKRKLLTSNLKPLLGDHSAELSEQAGVAKNARAEDAPLDAWLKLSST